MCFISNSDFGANLLLPVALHNNEFGWGLLVKTNWKKQEKRALAQNLKSQPEILKNQRRLPLGNREFREKVVHFFEKNDFAPDVATRRCEAAPTRTRTPLQPEKENHKCALSWNHLAARNVVFQKTHVQTNWVCM
jgi:hypothetical protein